MEIEKVLLEHKPDRVLVYGDTNSTLAGALAAAKLHIPVAHVEAGLRSFNMQMPEEINRISKPVKVLQPGDVMQDAALLFAEQSAPPGGETLPEKFILATLHRAENTDDSERLANIVNALNQLHRELAPVILPLHPRTRKRIAEQRLELNVHLINPVGYLEMVWLLDRCGLVLTDSGGVQKEAYFFGKACLTMRDQTEWVELIEAGANELVGADSQRIMAAAERHFGRHIQDIAKLYGGGKASQRIVSELANNP